MLGATVWVAMPGIERLSGGQPDDSFPISRFGMFASRRGDVQSLVYIRGIDRKGKKRPVRAIHVWPGGMNTSWRRLRQVAGSGRAARKRACQDIARRVAKKRGFRRLREVEIVRAHFSVREFFGKGQKADRTPMREHVIVHCRIERDG